MDVIEYAAPSVQHIHLHWSGNQTVLYGWASSENGMLLLCKNPRSLLSKITLHAYQVYPLLREQMEKPRSDAWIEAMERFRGSLIRMHDKNMLTPSEFACTRANQRQVALLDDGNDLQDFNTYRFAQCTGVSYCSSNISNGDPWWKSTNGHGTIMANMISRINPWVQLEVIKVQSSPSYIHGDGARSMSPRSATDAINAAVVRGADIISMSWTITDVGFRMSVLSDSASNVDGDKRRADENDLKLLQSAIDDAVKGDKRLLICSAADDVRLNGDNTFPYSQAPELILRIGSTGPQANRDLGSGSGGSITYYLPGNQVAEDRRPHSAKPVVYHNGSSVSTALAAGLASDHAGAEYENCAKALRSHANMRKAFNSINRYFEWKDDDKIVPVWGLFGDKSSMLDKATNSEDKIKVLKELVACLCLDIK
ncbi:hypothetical protein M752DRAFT_284857 [Aspergillus phoenicis ATCC 13157]|uniref:Peptidase S8/S53 domain-containing protein n=1 Tax=Aspergillus phoenicis ATCC 13157 TaxID=1353007 RepID=A0A370PEL2_ASPPH|nr:hypothetical protein M752DRAFT_284857 [Aspergillus phoenicis ATCC 13157]